MSQRSSTTEEIPNHGVWTYLPNKSGTGLYFAKFPNEGRAYIHLRRAGNPDGNSWFEYTLGDFNKSFRLHKNVEDLRIAKLKALFIILHSLNEQNTINEMLIELEI